MASSPNAAHTKKATDSGLHLELLAALEVRAPLVERHVRELVGQRLGERGRRASFEG